MTEDRVYDARDIDRIIERLKGRVGCRKAKIKLSGAEDDQIVDPEQIDLHELPLGVEALAVACAFGELCFGAPGGRPDCPLSLNEGMIQYVFEE